jgi:hypothetical protein
MRKYRLPLILLLLVALLYAASLVLGAQQGRPRRATLDVGWVRALASGLLSSRHVALGDLASAVPPSCWASGRDALLVPAGTLCVVTIKGSSLPRRALLVQLAQGKGAEVSLTQEVNHPGANWTAKDTLAPGGTSTKLDVFKRGGALAVQCAAGGQACRLELR